MDPTTLIHHKVVPAGRCGHNDPHVFVFIGSDDDHNTIYADKEEHVQPKGCVTFYAGSPCTLYFSNDEIFGEKQVPLGLGSNPLTVIGRGETFYSINEPPHSGPIIVVP